MRKNNTKEVLLTSTAPHTAPYPTPSAAKKEICKGPKNTAGSTNKSNCKEIGRQTPNQSQRPRKRYFVATSQERNLVKSNSCSPSPVEKILCKRIVNNQVEYLVKWKNSDVEASWEPVNPLKRFYSDEVCRKTFLSFNIGWSNCHF